MTKYKKMQKMMTMKVNCFFKLCADDIVGLCKRMSWYTCGTMIEYAEMLDQYDDKVLTVEELQELAADILVHTENDDDIAIDYVMTMLADKAEVLLLKEMYDKD